jgi:Zn-dependent protease
MAVTRSTTIGHARVVSRWRDRFRWQSGYLRVGAVRRADVRVHWALLAVGALLVIGGYGVGFLALVLLVLAHELGHLVLAQRSGLVPLRIDLHLLGGHCVIHDAWATPWNRAVVAWGGVLAQAALLIATLVCVKTLPMPRGWIEPYLSQVLIVLLPLNLGVLFFNLIPLAPLDGHQAWALVPMIPGRLRAWRAERRARAATAEHDRRKRRSIHAARAKARGIEVVRPPDDELH